MTHVMFLGRVADLQRSERRRLSSMLFIVLVAVQKINGRQGQVHQFAMNWYHAVRAVRPCTAMQLSIKSPSVILRGFFIVNWASPNFSFLFQKGSLDSPNFRFSGIDRYWDSPTDHLEMNERQGQVYQFFMNWYRDRRDLEVPYGDGKITQRLLPSGYFFLIEGESKGALHRNMTHIMVLGRH